MKLSPAQREAVSGFLYISPWIFGFLIFVLGPMAASLFLSLTRYNVLKPPTFVGLDNYVYVFTRDRLFVVALERTTYYAVAAVAHADRRFRPALGMDLSSFYVYHIFTQAFQDSEMGYASALAWIFFAILLVFTAIQFRLQRYWVYYESETHR